MSAENGPSKGLDLGFVEAVDEPKGISWVAFGSLYLEGYEQAEELRGDSKAFDIVPVATSDLTAAKGSEPQASDFFWAEINGSATSQADVDPSCFEFAPPLTPEEQAQFEGRE